MTTRRDASSLISILGLLSTIIAVSEPLSASTTVARQVAITITAGESYVIKDLDPDATPSIHVVSGPDALVIHGEKPGELVLLGVAAGEWIIRATVAAGERINYDVNVKAIASPFSKPLEPSKSPPAIGSGSGASTSASSGSAAALSPGTAPVSTAAETDLLLDATSTSAPVQTGSGSATSASSAKPAPAGSAETTPIPADGSSARANKHNSPGGPANIAGRLFSSQTAAAAAERFPQTRFRSDPLALPQTPAESNVSGSNLLPDDAVVVMAGASRIFDFRRRIRRISIADTDVADLQVINPYQINLVGHRPGFTTLAVWDNFGDYQERQVRVDQYGKAQVMLNVIVAELDRSRIEQQGVNWSAALPNYNVSLLGLGPAGVATPYSANSALSSSVLLGAGTPQQTLLTTNATGTLPPGGEIIPLLLSPTLNYGLVGQNSNVSAQTFFSFLETHNLGKILAEPHLLANSGEKAEFLSGGEIPIVVAQALNTSIVFKQFGTSVIFVPTVVGSQDVELEVKPEVSQPDYAHAVNLFGFSVPAFVTRRAKTFVRLKNNQTFIIAGLILHTPVAEVDKTPYLGDVPYLGGLFRHTQYTDQATDLVMTVTPQIVQALPANGEAMLPIARGPLTEEEIRTQQLAEPDASRPRF
jgi:pilus assembly protein CpaC